MPDARELAPLVRVAVARVALAPHVQRAAAPRAPRLVVRERPARDQRTEVCGGLGERADIVAPALAQGGDGGAAPEPERPIGYSTTKSGFRLPAIG